VTDLTTLAAAKLYSGITTTADDALLQSLVTAYSQWVRSYCSRDFTVANYEIWRDGRCSRFILLPQYPVTAIALLEVDGKAIAAQSSFGQPGYRFNAPSGNPATDTPAQLVLDGYEFTWGLQNIHVQFTAGYATVPADIAQAVNELVGLRYALRDKQGWTSKSLAGEVVSLSTRDMPASVATILNQYSRKVPL
jgi:hypothetical protein